MQFVQTVADLTARPQNVEILQKAGKKQNMSLGKADAEVSFSEKPSHFSPFLFVSFPFLSFLPVTW